MKIKKIKIKKMFGCKPKLFLWQKYLEVLKKYLDELE